MGMPPAHQRTRAHINFGAHRSPEQNFCRTRRRTARDVIVNQGNWQQQLEDNKQSFTSEFVQRLRFTTALPTSLTLAQYVDKLNTNA
jgi:hypothetical protein